MILHVSSVHSRKDVRIFHKMCVSLVGEGVEASLLVADGEAGECIKGVRIQSVPKPSGRLSRMLLVPFRIAKTVLELHPNIVHIHDPELLLVGLYFRYRGIAVIYDAHEDLPKQILSKHWIPIVLRNVISSLSDWLEKWLSKKMSGVVAATETISAKFGGKGIRAIAVHNYPILDKFSLPADQNRDSCAVCYIGGLSRERGIKELILALELLPGVKLYLAGPWITKSFNDECAKLPGWLQVEYLGNLVADEVPPLLTRCSIGLVTLWPTPNYIESLPVKLFEYMASGLPVIGSDFQAWRNLIVGSGAGVVVNPCNPELIAQTISNLLADADCRREMSINGLKFVAEHFSWRNEFRKLVDFYNSI